MINHILLAFVATFIITVVLGKIAIPMLRSLHAQQSIREEGPESHQAKAGTPTMGGPYYWRGIVCTMECGHRNVIILNTGSLFIRFF